MDLSKLLEPFPPEDIEWRLQSCGKKGDRIWAKCLAYVTNRAVMARLDDICGPENWRNEFQASPCGGVMCGISVWIGERGWVTKWDGAENTEIEAVKGGLSGSMKRAAVQWGIGRYLYQLEEGFAVINDKGAYSGKTKDGTWFDWDPPALPRWALPDGYAPATKRPPSAREKAPATIPQTAPVAPTGNPWEMLMPIGKRNKDKPLHEISDKDLRDTVDWCNANNPTKWEALIVAIGQTLEHRTRV